MALWTRPAEVDPYAYQIDIDEPGIPIMQPVGNAWNPATLKMMHALGIEASGPVLAGLAKSDRPDYINPPGMAELSAAIQSAVAAKLWPPDKSVDWSARADKQSAPAAEQTPELRIVEPGPAPAVEADQPAAPASKPSYLGALVGDLLRPEASTEIHTVRSWARAAQTTVKGVGLTATGRLTSSNSRPEIILTDDGQLWGSQHTAYGHLQQASPDAAELWAAGLLDDRGADELGARLDGYNALSLLYKQARTISEQSSSYSTVAQPGKKIWGVPLGTDPSNPDLLLSEGGTLFVLRTDPTTGRRVIRTTISFDRAEELAGAALAAEQPTSA